MSEILLLGVSFLASSVMLGGVALVLTTHRKVPSAAAAPAAASPQFSPTDGGIYSMMVDGKYLGMKYTPGKPTGFKCTGTLTSLKKDAVKVMLTKSGAGWQIKPDCDRDGKYTSYLTSDAARIVQPRNDSASQIWTATCDGGSRTCSFLSPNTRYLSATSSAPTLGQTKTLWTLDALK